ncbi:MAG: hypothetical protein Sapg2KO_22250 [Saprospiraceae bacterium]
MLLTVLGILLALYINTNNANKRYEKQIDNNFVRVYHELEKNVENTRTIIERLHTKDSLIHLVMHDSIDAKDYPQNFELAYLIINYHNLVLENKAYQNLIELNTSEKSYQDSLLSSLKELYSINEYITEANTQATTFVYEVSLPLLGKKIASFGDLTYKSQIKKDAIDYFTNDEEYKSYVSQYAIIAIKNQLRHNQSFLKEAQIVLDQIEKNYEIEPSLASFLEADSVQAYLGEYQFAQARDTMSVQFKNDSLYLLLSSNMKLDLVPISRDRFFTDNEGLGYFVTFNKKTDKPHLRLSALSINYTYEKIDP